MKKSIKYFYLWLLFIAVTLIVSALAISTGNKGYFIRLWASITYFMAILITSELYYRYRKEKELSK